MNWRPIKTAPKDKPVLLLYQGHDHLPFVGYGQWVDSPHENRYMAALKDVIKLDAQDYEGHWQIGYIAIYESDGATSHWKAQSYLVFPTHWQPVPRPPKKLPRGYQQPQS